MPHQIESIEYRQQIIKEIKGTENEARKVESLRQVEIYNDRIYQHVWERLRRNFSQNTLSEMPVIASINLARRIAKQEASIYKTAPKRTWTNLTDQQIEVVKRIYKDMGIDSKMLKSNESFKLQNQNHLMVIPKKGKLVMRVSTKTSATLKIIKSKVLLFYGGLMSLTFLQIVMVRFLALLKKVTLKTRLV